MRKVELYIMEVSYARTSVDFPEDSAAFSKGQLINKEGVAVHNVSVNIVAVKLAIKI